MEDNDLVFVLADDVPAVLAQLDTAVEPTSPT